jgi:hypothetical protein
MPFTPEDNLRLAIRYGLVKGLRLVRGLRQQFNEDDRTRVAETIREAFALLARYWPSCLSRQGQVHAWALAFCV